MERLVGRVAFGNVNGRDLLQLKSSLQQVPLIAQLIKGINRGEWNDLLIELEPLDELVALIDSAIDEDAPLQITEGNVIKDGFHEQLDKYREAMRNGKQWLAELEAKERQETGIKNLKVGFNRVLVITSKSPKPIWLVSKKAVMNENRPLLMRSVLFHLN